MRCFLFDVLSVGRSARVRSIVTTADAVVAEVMNRVAMVSRREAKTEAMALVQLWRRRFAVECARELSSSDIIACLADVRSRLDQLVAHIHNA